MSGMYVELPGSERPAKADADRVRDADAAAPVEVTITLRGPAMPSTSVPVETIDRATLAERYGANPDDVERVRTVLGQFGLTVAGVSTAGRSLSVRGTVAQMEEAFRANLGIYNSPEQGEFRGRSGALQIPEELAGIVTGVFGLDERRVAKRLPALSATTTDVAAAPAPAEAPPLGPSDLEARYAFPAGDATGQTIGIAEFGGGYFESDLQAFCAKYGRAMPTVTTVPLGAPA